VLEVRVEVVAVVPQFLPFFRGPVGTPFVSYLVEPFPL
jgi:hypothetical protein